jgi:hypothetical protein
MVCVSCQIRLSRIFTIDQIFDYLLLNMLSHLMSVYLPFWNMSQNGHVTSLKMDNIYLMKKHEEKERKTHLWAYGPNDACLGVVWALCCCCCRPQALVLISLIPIPNPCCVPVILFVIVVDVAAVYCCCCCSTFNLKLDDFAV